MRVFLWHVHGSWMTAFVQGDHEYFVPVLPDRGPDGRGRAETWTWPESVIEVDPAAARELEVDLAILQRPEELEFLAAEWLGRKPGRDLPAIYLEHNAPEGLVTEMVHPVRDRDDLLLVHVTHFNRLFWDGGGAPVRVIEHGVIDPGYRYVGDLERAVAIINEPGRRGRTVGADILARLSAEHPVDLFGIDSQDMGGLGNLPQDQLHEEMARRRVYLHPYRWTSLGLSLIEAMMLGLPVVAVGTTEASEAVPEGAGFVSTRPEVLRDALAQLIGSPEEARRMGKAAREAALDRYGLERFLRDWDEAMIAAVRGS